MVTLELLEFVKKYPNHRTEMQLTDVLAITVWWWVEMLCEMTTSIHFLQAGFIQYSQFPQSFSRDHGASLLFLSSQFWLAMTYVCNAFSHTLCKLKGSKNM